MGSDPSVYLGPGQSISLLIKLIPTEQFSLPCTQTHKVADPCHSHSSLVSLSVALATTARAGTPSSSRSLRFAFYCEPRSDSARFDNLFAGSNLCVWEPTVWTRRASLPFHASSFECSSLFRQCAAVRSRRNLLLGRILNLTALYPCLLPGRRTNRRASGEEEISGCYCQQLAFGALPLLILFTHHCQTAECLT